MTIPRIPATLAVLAVAVLAACSSPAASQPAPHQDRHVTSTADHPSGAQGPEGRPVLGTGGAYWVGWLATTFTEPAHAGLAARRLLTQIWYPLAGRPSKNTPPAPGPFPVIAFAPGFMQCGGPYGKMLRYWASAGYVVVVVNFPHADCKVGNAATESDLLNEPHDMSYVITRMLRLSRAKHGIFAGLLNPRQIAAAGQSDGGDTVAALVANTCCTDRRVVAAAVESGAEWPPMAGRYFTSVPAPILFSQGTADTINPPGCSVRMYLADPGQTRFYLDLFGASHTGPYWGINKYERIAARTTLAFFNRYVLKHKNAAGAIRRQGNKAGLAATYSDGGGGLTAGYCNT